jgi:hypothetical protein
MPDYVASLSNEGKELNRVLFREEGGDNATVKTRSFWFGFLSVFSFLSLLVQSRYRLPTTLSEEMIFFFRRKE